MIKKTITLLCVYLLISAILTAGNEAVSQNEVDCSVEFNHFFKFEKKVTLSEEKNLIGRLRKLLIGSNGNFLILDSKKNKINKYTPKGEFLSSIGGKGQGPGEFVKAFDFAIDKENMYVVDPMARKVHVFTIDGKFKHFFSIEDGRIIRTWKDGALIIAAPRFIDAKNSACIHIYDKNGKRKRSFFPINKNSIRNNLIIDGVSFDLDKEGSLYCIQEMEYKINHYTLSGQLLETFSKPQSYYIPPTDKRGTKMHLRTEVLKWIKSWTHIFDINILNDFVIVTLNYPKVPYEYVLDVYNKKGDFIKGGLATNYRLLYTDKKQNLYFLDESLSADSQEAAYNILIYSIKKKNLGSDDKK
ncbi:MAG: 6-bladed beta-propeller [Candidatus Aminicenantes bacterium]|nr:6-bladed beta-propeller [Candidatus Aminicenantes bacterium]